MSMPDLSPYAARPLTPVGPPPPCPRLVRQDWSDVTFLHWAVDPTQVARHLPVGTRPDVLDGVTYVGLVPFRLSRSRIARGLVLPGYRDLLETNVRLYSVDSSGRRGVVFLSLDADSASLVAAGRSMGLPYRQAVMSHHQEGGLHTYQSTVRRSGVSTRVSIRAGDPRPASELELFLTARWGLHVRRCGKTWWLPNTHPEWPVRDASLLEFDDELLPGHGLHLDRPPDLVFYSAGVATQFGRPSLVSGC
jgi:uncharacterized protein